MKGIPANGTDEEGLPIPFYVDYPDTEEAAAKRRRTGEEGQAKQVFDVTTKEGQDNLVGALDSKWGLRKDRFDRPARLKQGGFPFAQTQQRADAFKDLLTIWKTHFQIASDRSRLSLPAVPAAPGTGKTRFAWLAVAKGLLPGIDSVDGEWSAAMDGLEDGDFKTGIQNAVGVAVTFNCDADPILSEEHECMIGVRMLYGHFCDVMKVTFKDFLELLHQHGCHGVSSVKALQIIEQDIEAKHALEGGTKRHVILVVDEPLRALNGTMVERQKQLGAITSSVGLLMTNFPNVHVLMTSLSGSDLSTATKTASGRAVHFVKFFAPLSKEAVELLISAEEEGSKKARLQTDKRFRAVLNECLGVPRVLEKVFLAADSPLITGDSSCEAIRLKVGHLFESHHKYKVRHLRNDALVAALSGPWRPTSEKRQEQTGAAEREGYLFDGRIPPLLLFWWSAMPDEQCHADEAHALLKAAIGIYTLSQVVDGAEHGTRFERQLAHLWRILTITDAVSRREGDRHVKRTIHGVLGRGLLDVAGGAVSVRSLDDAAAAFNLSLNEPDTELLHQPFQELDKPDKGPTNVQANAAHGIPYFPKDKQNPGFDFAMKEPTSVAGGHVLVLVEAKFSGVDATTKLSQGDIVDKFVLAVKDRPSVQKCLLESRLCYIIGGLQSMNYNVIEHREKLIDAIVKSLRFKNVAKHVSLKTLVGQSLVLLTREHVEALLTPTLASLPPFGQRW
jgi:hypothetical protein